MYFGILLRVDTAYSGDTLPTSMRNSSAILYLALSLLCFTAFRPKAAAQLSVMASVENPEAPYWDGINDTELRFLNAGFGFGAGYLWKIGENTIATIGPFIRYQHFTGGPMLEGLANISLTGLELKGRIYPGKLLLSCDCQELKDRVFFEISGAWHYARMELHAPDIYELVQDKSPSYGIGMGLHFPIGKRISLDPVIRFCQFPEINWEGLDRFAVDPANPLFRTTSDLNVFQIELHLQLKSFK